MHWVPRHYRNSSAHYDRTSILGPGRKTAARCEPGRGWIRAWPILTFSKYCNFTDSNVYRYHFSRNLKSSEADYKIEQIATTPVCVAYWWEGSEERSGQWDGAVTWPIRKFFVWWASSLPYSLSPYLKSQQSPKLWHVRAYVDAHFCTVQSSSARSEFRSYWLGLGICNRCTGETPV